MRVRQNRATELALRGGRQGCILGGTICNPSYGRASEAFYERAEAEHLPVKENSAPNALDDDKTKDAVVLDVTFVDDEAIAVLASVPATLTQKLSRIITALRAAFAELGMTIISPPGKYKLRLKVEVEAEDEVEG